MLTVEVLEELEKKYSQDLEEVGKTMNQLQSAYVNQMNQLTVKKACLESNLQLLKNMIEMSTTE